MYDDVGTEKTSGMNVKINRTLNCDHVSLTIQFFQCQLFGFADETEDHEPGNQIESSIESDWCKR